MTQKPVGVIVLAVLDFVGAGVMVLVALGLAVGLSVVGMMMHRPGTGATMAAGVLLLGRYARLCRRAVDLAPDPHRR